MCLFSQTSNEPSIPGYACDLQKNKLNIPPKSKLIVCHVSKNTFNAVPKSKRNVCHVPKINLTRYQRINLTWYQRVNLTWYQRVNLTYFGYQRVNLTYDRYQRVNLTYVRYQRTNLTYVAYSNSRRQDHFLDLLENRGVLDDVTTYMPTTSSRVWFTILLKMIATEITSEFRRTQELTCLHDYASPTPTAF